MMALTSYSCALQTAPMARAAAAGSSPSSACAFESFEAEHGLHDRGVVEHRDHVRGGQETVEDRYTHRGSCF
jgi:hypothetical protein